MVRYCLHQSDDFDLQFMINTVRDKIFNWAKMNYLILFKHNSIDVEGISYVTGFDISSDHPEIDYFIEEKNLNDYIIKQVLYH